MPKVFTEQGVAMLSGVLNSDRAIMVNIQIMRAYTKMRELLLTHKDLLLKMEVLEKRVIGAPEPFLVVVTLVGGDDHYCLDACGLAC